MPTFTELQEVLLAHAFELAEAIVGRTLDDPDGRAARDALRRAMAAAPEHGRHRGQPAPRRLPQSGRRRQPTPTTTTRDGRCTCAPNPALRPGDAVAETGTATVDATIAAAVARPARRCG